jgi:2,4-dienoyl-CoA reductase-like NADH-dependent reductase (Old Yellow Enzyme family)
MDTSSTPFSRRSRVSNTRSDAYGGQSFENRTRFFLPVVKVVRALWGEKPLFVRLSASDLAEHVASLTEG